MNTKKPYRSLYFNDERKWKRKHPLDDVLQVGKQKAIGYITWTPFRENEEIKDLIFQLVNNHSFNKDILVVLTNSDSSSHECFPILYVGSESMIQHILDKNNDTLIKSNWPINAKEFFHKICFNDIDHPDDPELYHLICDLFNSWCLWCEEPIRDLKSNNFLSKHPYDSEMDK